MKGQRRCTNTGVVPTQALYQHRRCTNAGKLKFTGAPLTPHLSFWTKWRISSFEPFWRVLRTRFFVAMLLRMTKEEAFFS